MAFRCTQALLLLALLATAATAWIGTYNLYELPIPKAPTLSLIAGGTIPVGQTVCVKMVTAGRGRGAYGENGAQSMISRPSNESCITIAAAGFQNINVTFEDCGADCASWAAYLNTTPGGYSPRPYAWNETAANWIYILGRHTSWYMGGFTNEGVNWEGTPMPKANSTTLYWFNFSTITPYFGYSGGRYQGEVGWNEYYPSGIPFVNITGGTVANPITPQDIYNWLQYLNSTQDIMDCSPKMGIRAYGGNWECGYLKLRASLGEMGTVSYGTVFNIPKNIIFDQEWGKLTFNVGGNFTIGTYNPSTDTPADGGVYRRTGIYGIYNQVVSFDWNGAFLGGGYTMLGANLSYAPASYAVQGHQNQVTNNPTSPLWRMVGTTYYGAIGRYNAFYGDYVVWRSSTFIGGRESVFGKTGSNSNNINDFRSAGMMSTVYMGGQTIAENLVYGHVLSDPYAYLYFSGTPGSNTTISRFINCKYVGTTVPRVGITIQLAAPFNASVYSAIATNEYTLALTVVNQNNAAIPYASVSIFNATGSRVGAYAKLPLTDGASGSTNQTVFGNILYLRSIAGVAVGDNLYIGNEYLNVTSIINSTAVGVTRGLFGSRLNSITGNTGTPRYEYSLSVYRGNQTWVTNTTGQLPLLNLVVTREQYLGTSVGTLFMNFKETQTPFRIEVNASGYQNATYYYTPTQGVALSLTLTNATECPNCTNTTIYLGGGTYTVDDYLRVTSELPVANPPSAFDPNTLLMLVGGVLLGLFYFSNRPNRDAG